MLRRVLSQFLRVMGRWAPAALVEVGGAEPEPSLASADHGALLGPGGLSGSLLASPFQRGLWADVPDGSQALS